MAKLSNAKHELFAQNIAKGEPNSTAYLGAGFTASNRNSADASASKLLNTAKIAKRVNELLAFRDVIDRGSTAKAIENLAITKERILGELAKIGFSNMFDYIKTQDDGSAIVDLSKLSRDQAAAITEVTVETYVEAGQGDDDPKTVKKIRFKLSDKRPALVDMGKHLGMFIERREVGKPGDFDEKTDDELATEIADEAEAMGLISQGSRTVN